MKVLIAEDDSSVVDALRRVLEQRGHIVTAVARGSEVLLRHHGHDVLLLDLGLLDEDGFATLRRLRRVADLPVVVVTAHSDERSTVRALHLGADDYLVKPVRVHELLARLDAVVRRRAERPEVDGVTARGISIDLAARAVTAAGTPIALTAKEFDLLAALARRPGTAVSRDQILDEVWGDAFAAASRSFDVHLTQLRAKLPDPTAITTIRGFGYRLEAG